MTKVVLNGRTVNTVNSTIRKSVNFEPNTLSVDIDNTDLFYVLNASTEKIEDINNNVIDENLEIYVEIDGIRQFTGYTERPRLNSTGKILRITAKDSYRILQNTTVTTDKHFYNETFDTILKYLLNLAGITDYTNVYSISYVINTLQIFDGDNVIDYIEKLVKSVGGKIYFNENNKVVFDGGFVSQINIDPSTTTKYTLNLNYNTDINYALPAEKFSRIQVQAKPQLENDELVYIYTNKDFPIEDNPLTFFAEFDNDVFFVDSLVDVEYSLSAGLSINSTVWANNFVSGNLPKNTKEFQIQIDGGAVGKQINYIKIKGKEFKEKIYNSFKGSGKLKLYESTIIQNETWTNNLLEWLYITELEKPQITLTLTDYPKALNITLGDKLNIVDEESGTSNRCIIKEFTLNTNNATAQMTLQFDRLSKFTPGTNTINLTDKQKIAPNDLPLSSVAGQHLAPVVDMNDDEGSRIQYDTNLYRLGKQALPDNSNGLWLNAGCKLLIGSSTTASKKILLRWY